ncbi:MAG: YdcF family protein [Chloroflexi bacterium]|nr:YdcF family protein [Chloroflexota bacterium]
MTDATPLQWPSSPSAVLIMGKRQGTKKENKQLWGRVALAAALWYSAPNPKPHLIFVASDVHGPQLAPDASLVKTLLVDRLQIPADFVITRQRTNCTLLEVRATRVLRRVYGLAHIFALTHLYHAARAQRYLDEVLPDASVIPVHLDILNEIQFPLEATALWLEMRALIKDSQPGRLDALREHIIEWLLNQAHTLDPRGRYERRLAHLLRPGAYAEKGR